MNQSILVIQGAPGVGKSTVSVGLGTRIECPVIDFGKLREFHLDSLWERASDTEEAMAFGLLLKMMYHYLEHRYIPVIVNDIREHRVFDILSEFSDVTPLVVTLLVAEYTTLQRRIETRDKGWRDVEAAWQWNERLKMASLQPGEVRFTVDGLSEEEVLSEVYKLITSV